MSARVQWPASDALAKRLKEINEAAKLSGKGANRVKGDIRRIVIEDNTDKLLGRGLLEGVDRYGKPLARMADSTYRKKGRGFGPVLAPKGMASRFITNFRAEWQDSGRGFNTLVCFWLGMVNKQGQSFAQYHLTGAKKPGTKWVVPKRDIGGVTPKGMAAIRARIKKYMSDAIRGTT